LVDVDRRVVEEYRRSFHVHVQCAVVLLPGGAAMGPPVISPAFGYATFRGYCGVNRCRWVKLPERKGRPIKATMSSTSRSSSDGSTVPTASTRTRAISPR
jgi:hypothetical protein